MKTQRAMFLVTALALLIAPALAQDGHAHSSSGSQMGPATMNDMRGMMQTLMNDPVISKRMNELMASNPAFKTHFDRMRSTMNSAGMMPNGSGGMNDSMMSGSPTPKP